MFLCCFKMHIILMFYQEQQHNLQKDLMSMCTNFKIKILNKYLRKKVKKEGFSFFHDLHFSNIRERSLHKIDKLSVNKVFDTIPHRFHTRVWSGT